MSTILYFDAAQHGHDGVKSTRNPVLESELQRLGFRVLGEVLAIPQNANPVRVYADDQDQAEHEAILKGTLSAVMVAQDGSAFGTTERAHDMNYLRLRTLLETGDIVETRLQPRRTMRYVAFDHDAPPAATEEEKQAREATEEMLENLMGRDDAAKFPDLAAAGLHRETLAEQSAEDIWKRHRERVTTIAGRLGTVPVDHQAMGLFLAITRRGWHVQESYTDRRMAGFVWFQVAMTTLLIGAGLAVGWAAGFDGQMVALQLATAGLLCVVCEWPSNQRPLLTWSIGVLASLLVGAYLGLGLWPLFAGIFYYSFVFAFRHVWALLFMVRIGPPLLRRLPYPRRVAARELEKVYQSESVPPAGERGASAP